MATVLRRPGLVYARKGGVHGQVFVWDRARGTITSTGAAANLTPDVWTMNRVEGAEGSWAGRTVTYVGA